MPHHKTTILGSSTSPLGTLVTALHRVGCSDVCVVGHQEVRDARAHLVTSVRRLREVAPLLNGRHTLVLVQDALQCLRTVDSLRVIDRDDDAWAPRPIRMQALRDALALSREHPVKLSFVENDVLERMVEESRKRGVLGHVLAYAQRLSNSQEREAVNAMVVRHLMGELEFATLRRRTTPSKPALVEDHARMCDALNSESGRALRAAVHDASRGTDPLEAADRHGADAFEVRFTLYHHDAGSKSRAKRKVVAS